MTDHELLELAAKAAGIRIFFGIEWHDVGECYTGSRAVPRSWNPLTSDGDALRLAVNLRMSIHYETQRFDRQDVEIVEVHHSHDADLGSCQCVAMAAGEDAGAATRRAITRAAAEIGRGYRD